MMTLTYLNDLSRVRIELSDISPDGAVRVENAALTPDPPWEVVRGATQLPIVSGVGQADSYEFYADVQNWYRAVRVDPHPGLLLDGSSGSYASTPDDASLDITGDIDLRVDATVEWIGGAPSGQVLLAKFGNVDGTESYQLGMDPDGLIDFVWSTDGTDVGVDDARSTVPVVPGPDGRLAIRITMDVDNDSGGYTVTFYTAPSMAGPWTELGDPTIGGATTSIFSGSAELAVGGRSNGGAFPPTGTIHAVEVRDGIDGTVVADPNFADEDDGTGSFADDAGNTWTVNGTAVIVGEIVEGPSSITPDLEGVTWLKSVTYPALNRPIGVAPDYRPVQRSSRTGVFNVKGRVPPIAVYDAWTSRWWTMEFVTETLEAARDMDLVLAASRTLFVHTPAEDANSCFTNPVSGMPGGYVMAQNATMRHTVGGSHVMQWVLPVRQVAPPVPEVSGGTLTWNTLRRLYGSWNALWAAYGSWRELWETIGDPEDAL